jgi:ornithine cyclodeaminase
LKNGFFLLLTLTCPPMVEVSAWNDVECVVHCPLFVTCERRLGWIAVISSKRERGKKTGECERSSDIDCFFCFCFVSFVGMKLASVGWKMAASSVAAGGSARGPATSRSYPGRRGLLLLSERDVQTCLSMKDCLDVNRKALIALAQGQAHVPTRIGLPYPNQESPQANYSSSSSSSSSSSDMSASTSTVAAAAQDWTLFKPAAYYPHHHHHHPSSSSGADIDEHDDSAGAGDHDDHHNKLADDDDDDDDNETRTLMGVKIVSVRANNTAKYKLPLVPATIVSVDAETGLVQAIVAGTYLTAARTAAGSALSTALAYQQKRLRCVKNNSNDHMPRPLFQHLVVFGAGLQAKLHIQAIATAMSDYNNVNNNDIEQEQQQHHSRISPIPLVSIINRSEERALELKNEILGNNNNGSDASSTDNDDDHFWAREVQTVLLDDKAAVAKTLSTANVVVTATNTIEALWKDDGDMMMMMMMLPRGCHIAGVGSYTPHMREVPLSTARKCHIWMDTPEARFVGDLKDLPDSHPMTLIGQALLEQQQNDTSSRNIGVGGDENSIMDYTFFKSVGTAIQDVMTADMVVQRARELNIGQEIDMS